MRDEESSIFGGATVVAAEVAVGNVPDVVAIIQAYNEEDIFAATLSHLTGQGIGVWVLDHGSTDETAAIARSFLGRGVLAVERFPVGAGDGPCFDLKATLRRKARLAVELARRGARWVMHYDADELRESPWPGVSLRDGLLRVEAEGYNAVDHVVLLFVPTEDGFARGMDVAQRFRRFIPLYGGAPLQQVKAWVQKERRVELAASAGHAVEFAGRRVYPIPFLNRHYPIRSTKQGRRKVAERLERCDPRRRAEGWHTHYAEIGDQRHPLIFPADRPDLKVWDEAAFKREFLEWAARQERSAAVHGRGIRRAIARLIRGRRW